MKVQINEVWNDDGRTEKLAVIDVTGNPYLAVVRWIESNRPDLSLAETIYAHGYHATEVKV